LRHSANPDFMFLTEIFFFVYILLASNIHNP
jgi:hypothetical protein